MHDEKHDPGAERAPAALVRVREACRDRHGDERTAQQQRAVGDRGTEAGEPGRTLPVVLGRDLVAVRAHAHPLLAGEPRVVVKEAYGPCAPDATGRAQSAPSAPR